MIRFPNAKINLGLNIVADRPDGYHDLETVFYPIPLRDVLEIVPAHGAETTLTCYGNAVDCPVEKNLVMRACRMMQQRHGVGDVDMYLYKHIPDGAGLGGGSADASTALMMLNDMFQVGLADEDVAAMAAEIGADCPFFVFNRPLMATGIGDVFSAVDVDLSGKTMLLIKPDVSVPTKVAYARVKSHPSVKPLPQVLSLPMLEWRSELHNDFEPSVFAAYEQLARIKEELYNGGAVYASMSGSGSSIFGIFDSAIMAEAAKSRFAGMKQYVMQL